MNNPKVSVIVPVYNVEKYLRRCVDSILSQTFTDFELLLVDDGSKDKSAVICDGYAAEDHRVRVFHKENGGVSSARNLGIEEARGEWISFVDADDWINSDYFENLLKAVKNSDMVISGFQYVLLRGGKLFFLNTVTPSLKLSYNELFSLPHTMSTPWCKLFKANIIKGNAVMFDEKMKMGEDTCFVNSYLCYVKNICFSEYSGYKYMYGSVVDLGLKYKMTTSEFVYHLTHIVESMQRVSRILGISINASIIKERKFFFNLYIEILKHLGIKELREYVAQYKLLRVFEIKPKELGVRKNLILNMAIMSPLSFYVFSSLLKIKNKWI